MQDLVLSPLESSSVSVLWYRRSKPVGKVRRRVQDLRIPSPSYSDFTATPPAQDLSHNESTRLAADSLLNRGLEGYYQVLNEEGEVDFLSKLEKRYFLENGKDISTDDHSTSDGEDDNKCPEKLPSSCHTATYYPAMSTDRNPGLDSPKDVKSPGRDGFRMYFQSDSRSSGMKDSVREFIRKAASDLAVVVDSFSDVELLCDLLEASRMRNVSVHLLLDHLNLDLFISMWKELKLDSKRFPKLSVQSVNGQTYYAKTGRKLMGQIAESFLIADWTEALTGSFSFSWLSWQVHRCLVVLLRGSKVEYFNQEFHRLYSSSKPVPGFANDISLPQAPPPHSTLYSVQNKNTSASKTKESKNTGPCLKDLIKDGKNTETRPPMPVLTDIPEQKSKCDTKPEHREDADGEMHEKSPQKSKPVVEPLQSAQAERPKQKDEAVSNLHDEPLKKNPSKKHTETTNAQPLLKILSANTVRERTAKVQDSDKLQMVSPELGLQHNRTARYHSVLESFSSGQHQTGGTKGLFLQQRNRDDSTTASGGLLSGLSTQRPHWNSSLNFKPNVNFIPHQPTVFSPPATSQGTQRHSQHLRQNKLTQQVKDSSSSTRSHLKPQIFPGAKLHPQLHTSQQIEPPPPRSNWIFQSTAAGPKTMARQSSFDFTYGTGQNKSAHAGWRSFPSSTNPRFVRSKSMNERHSHTSFKGAGLN